MTVTGAAQMRQSSVTFPTGGGTLEDVMECFNSSTCCFETQLTFLSFFFFFSPPVIRCVAFPVALKMDALRKKKNIRKMQLLRHCYWITGSRGSSS